MSTSDAVPGPLPPTFRRLVRNDTHQTNDQWKQNLLRETGATAPLWTACALAGAAPTVDIPRPLEPLKPSDPGIMAELKGEYRQALSVQMGIPIAEVPEVSSSTIWERYAIEKGAYDDKHELYKIRFKEVNETFPLENRKVFALVEKSISEASVDDIKRTPDGLKAYEARDAFAFLQLAMELHDYVPAQISDRACQNAQLRFEGYRQPASASIAEHLNEFRRRLDYYCKVRGDRVDDVYKDYQLKGLLLASLYPDAWGEWHRIRQLTSTMPATFEGVENALREEESARALSALKDPYGEALPSAAHATSTTESLPPLMLLGLRSLILPEETQPSPLLQLPEESGYGKEEAPGYRKGLIRYSNRFEVFPKSLGEDRPRHRGVHRQPPRARQRRTAPLGFLLNDGDDSAGIDRRRG